MCADAQPTEALEAAVTFADPALVPLPFPAAARCSEKGRIPNASNGNASSAAMAFLVPVCCDAWALEDDEGVPDEG